MTFIRFGPFSYEDLPETREGAARGAGTGRSSFQRGVAFVESWGCYHSGTESRAEGSSTKSLTWTACHPQLHSIIFSINLTPFSESRRQNRAPPGSLPSLKFKLFTVSYSVPAFRRISSSKSPTTYVPRTVLCS